MTRVRCRFDHAGATPAAVELVGRRGELEARRLSDVVPLLTEVEQASRSGLYAAGFVAYEAAPAFDPALAVPSGPPPGPVPAADLPLAWFGLFADARPVDPLVRVVPAPAGGGEPGDAGGDWPGRPGTRWSCETGSGEHADAVERIRSAIVDGDTYLVNLTTRFRRPWSEEDDPFVLYRRLVAGHSGGHHAYLETPEWAVACGSPELFFELRQGRLTTRPMKGTAPRGRWAEEDVARSEALRCSAKERAENVMVVDLLRNDLGRIAVPGSVAVPELWQVERHPTVWQLTSTVVARPRAGVGLAEVFGAVFPSGSVTGAPKVSAMSIIAELERSPRGVYCGAVGLVEPVGDRSPAAAAGRDGPPDDIVAHFAVAIRTAVVDKGRQVVEYGSGGGITWDSSVRAEWDEVLVKTRALADPGPLAGGVGLIETMGFFPNGPGGTRGTTGEPGTASATWTTIWPAWPPRRPLSGCHRRSALPIGSPMRWSVCPPRPGSAWSSIRTAGSTWLPPHWVPKTCGSGPWCSASITIRWARGTRACSTRRPTGAATTSGLGGTATPTTSCWSTSGTR